MCRWLQGNAVDESRWLSVMSANLSGAAISWMNLVELQVYQGARAPFADWREFTEALHGTFESATLGEQARRRLHSLRQYKSVEAYVREFQKWSFRLPDMSRAERYYQFIEGLKEPMRSTVASWVPEDPDQAIATALRLSSLQRGGWEQFQGQSQGRGQGRQSGGRGRGRGRGQQQQQHQVQAVSQSQQHQQQSQPDSVAAVQQGGRGRGRGRGQQGGDGGRGDGHGRGRGVCRLCKSPGHYVSVCPRLEEAARRLN